MPLFYIPNNKYICYFDSNNTNVKVNGYNNLKANSSITSATSLTYSYEDSSCEYDDCDESISMQSQQLVPTNSKSLAQIAAERIKQGRYSQRMAAAATKSKNYFDECDQSKSSKSTLTTMTSSTTASSSSTSSYKLPSTVLKYMFKCDGSKAVGVVDSNETPEKGKVLNNRTYLATKKGTIQDPSVGGSNGIRTTTTSAQSNLSKRVLAKRSKDLDATLNKATSSSFSSSSSSSSLATPVSSLKKNQEPIPIIISSKSSGYMIPIDEMNDMRPFDEENGVELQLLDGRNYYLAKIDNEIETHQRRVEKALNRRRRRSAMMTIDHTPSEADF